MNDPRKDILSKVPTKALLGIFGDLADPQLGCSVAFFALGMTAEFRETQPRDMLRLVFEELQSRMPNAAGQTREEEAS